MPISVSAAPRPSLRVQSRKPSAAQLNSLKDNWSKILSGSGRGWGSAASPRPIKERALPKGSAALARYRELKARGDTSVNAYKARLNGVDTYVLSRGSMGGGTTAYFEMFNASGRRIADGYALQSGEVLWR